MLKQLKEPQMQNKLQQLTDSRGQNAINQLSLTRDKQSSGAQFGLLNNGIRVRDPSQMFMFDNTSWAHESAGLLTKNKSQQAGIFSQSLSVDHNLSNKDYDNCLGFKNMFAKTENSIGFHSVQSGSWSVVMQPAVAEASSSDENNASHSPYVGLRLTNQSQTPLVNYFDQSRISQQTVSIRTEPLGSLKLKPSQSPQSENNHLSDQNHMTSRLVSVKNEDGQRRSTKPVNPSVTGSSEPPSTSYAANSRIKNPSSVHLKQNTHVLKSKKRKCSTLERLPWHKEVTAGSSRLHAIRTAELKWVRSVARVPEKVKESAKRRANSRLITNRKRRLNSTTQLMQLLFQPPPAIVLSEDAITHCDTVTYYASRLALGDACRLSSSAGENMTSKSSSDQDLLKVIQGFIDRSKSLADNFSRLEKGKSVILEVMMDSQDLEKVSFINRFAKFHARRSTVSGDRASSTMRKLYAQTQRCVKAIPMPKMVPEGQNCLLL